MSDSFWQDWNKSKAEFQRNRKTKNANRNLSLLKNNAIDYEMTDTINVVLLKNDDTEAYMSLTAGYNELFKIRFKGSAKWYSFTRKKLIHTFSKQK